MVGITFYGINFHFLEIQAGRATKINRVKWGIKCLRMREAANE